MPSYAMVAPVRGGGTEAIPGSGVTAAVGDGVALGVDAAAVTGGDALGSAAVVVGDCET